MSKTIFVRPGNSNCFAYAVGKPKTQCNGVNTVYLHSVLGVSFILRCFVAKFWVRVGPGVTGTALLTTEDINQGEVLFEGQ